MTLLPQQFLILASNNIILLFGWLIPVLSSVKGEYDICFVLIITSDSTYHCLSTFTHYGTHNLLLSSQSAVVRKDAEAYHQWTTYWLILHLYLTILSPILHFTLHPIFQILAILWLSLPQYQGAGKL